MAPETVRAPVMSRATEGFVVPIPTKPAALIVIPEEVALNVVPCAILNLSESESSTPTNHLEEGVAPVRKSIYGSNVLVSVSLEIVRIGEIAVYRLESSSLEAGEEVPMPTSPVGVILILSDPAVLKKRASSSEPDVSSASMNVSWSTSMTPPSPVQLEPLYPSKLVFEVLNRSIPAIFEDGRCAVVPAGICIASVVAITKETVGVVVAIPILLFKASMERVFESKLKESTALFNVMSTVWVEKSSVPELISNVVAVRFSVPVVVRVMLEEPVFSVVAPPSAIVRMSVPLSWKTTMLSVPL